MTSEVQFLDLEFISSIGVRKNPYYMKSDETAKFFIILKKICPVLDINIHLIKVLSIGMVEISEDEWKKDIKSIVHKYGPIFQLDLKYPQNPVKSPLNSKQIVLFSDQAKSLKLIDSYEKNMKFNDFIDRNWKIPSILRNKLKIYTLSGILLNEDFLTSELHSVIEKLGCNFQISFNNTKKRKFHAENNHFLYFSIQFQSNSIMHLKPYFAYGSENFKEIIRDIGRNFDENNQINEIFANDNRMIEKKEFGIYVSEFIHKFGNSFFLDSTGITKKEVEQKIKREEPERNNREIAERKAKEEKERRSREQKEQELLEKFQKVMRFSNRIEISRAAQMMKITEADLNIKLFDWSDDLPFKIDAGMIIVDDMNIFTSALDSQFDAWGQKELSKDGKI